MDSKGVLDQLLALADRCCLVPILGNHDQMMLNARGGNDDFRFWLNCGGITALDSYGSTGQLDLIPAAHFRFLERCLPYYETDTHMFLHANYKPDLPLYRLAAELSDRIAAIAPVAGPSPSRRANRNGPFPVIHFHGSKDNMVPFEMKKGKAPSFMKLKGVETQVQVSQGDHFAAPSQP